MEDEPHKEYLRIFSGIKNVAVEGISAITNTGSFNLLLSHFNSVRSVNLIMNPKGIGHLVHEGDDGISMDSFTLSWLGSLCYLLNVNSGESGSSGYKKSYKEDFLSNLKQCQISIGLDPEQTELNFVCVGVRPRGEGETAGDGTIHPLLLYKLGANCED